MELPVFHGISDEGERVFQGIVRVFAGEDPQRGGKDDLSEHHTKLDAGHHKERGFPGSVSGHGGRGCGTDDGYPERTAVPYHQLLRQCGEFLSRFSGGNSEPERELSGEIQPGIRRREV